MTGRERVTRAIEFTKPDRIPLLFPGFGIQDAIELVRASPAGWKPPRDGEDEWGCLWVKPASETGILNQGQIKEHPLAKASSPADLKHFPWPDPTDASRYRGFPDAIENAGDRYVIFLEPFMLLERAWSLRGMQKLFIDLYENPKLVHELLDRIMDFQLGILQSLKPYQGRIHAYHGGDDWGTQLAPYMGRSHFREFFKPRYAALISAAHELGMHTWLHSDGKINELIEEFIDVGLDVIEVNSPRTVGIEDISQSYRGRIAFECCGDIQTTLPFGTDEQITSEVKELIEKWGTPAGGLIAFDYLAHEAVGVDLAKVQTALDAFLRYGRLGDGENGN